MINIKKLWSKCRRHMVSRIKRAITNSIRVLPKKFSNVLLSENTRNILPQRNPRTFMIKFAKKIFHFYVLPESRFDIWNIQHRRGSAEGKK